MPQDYILRLLQQLGAVLATIAGKKSAGDWEGAQQAIEEQCLRETGLPLVVVRQSTPETLVQLLAMSGARQLPRTLLLGALLREDGEVHERRGNPAAAAVSYAQAERLLRDALPALEGEEARTFAELHAQVSAKRLDLAGP